MNFTKRGSFPEGQNGQSVTDKVLRIKYYRHSVTDKRDIHTNGHAAVNCVQKKHPTEETINKKIGSKNVCTHCFVTILLEGIW